MGRKFYCQECDKRHSYEGAAIECAERDRASDERDRQEEQDGMRIKRNKMEALSNCGFTLEQSMGLIEFLDATHWDY